MSNTPGFVAASVTIERPCLYLVGTPIGNLGDVTLRALATLQQVDCVLAEDTRTSLRLLDRYAINRPIESLHQHNEAVRVQSLIERIATNALAVALVSDAGTPLVSDPGYLLVKACQAAAIPVRYVPGPSAVLGALTVSGLPCERFVFEGFLPARQGARLARLQELQGEMRTLVVFEAPHRILATLTDMLAVLSATREIAVVRELTKLHETLYRGTLVEVLATMQADPNAVRGEIAIVVGAGTAPESSAELPAKLLSALLPRLSQRDALEVVGEVTGYPRNQLYEMALQLKKGAP